MYYVYFKNSLGFIFLQRLLIIISITFIKDITAQNIDQLKSIIPPSPNAASLGKYAEWPVNLYTGTPSINVPLYEMKGRSITVPISLNYHASGIKVNDIASWVGLGWSLDCGGVITRSVRGLPDEVQTSPGYFLVKQNYTNQDDLSSAPLDLSLHQSYLKRSANGECDTEQDIYSFNALGKSFKFIFKSNKFVTIPFSNVKVAVDFTQNIWNVVLEDGTVLIFGGTNIEKNNNTNFSAEVGTLSFTSSWYLKSVISSTNEIFNFTYTPTVLANEASYFESDYVTYSDYANASCLQIKHGSSNGITNQQIIYGLTLASIESDLERVEFEKESREDHSGDFALSAIKVYSKLASKYIDQFSFRYGYSNAIQSSAYKNDSYYLKRLKLLGVDHGLPGLSNRLTWRFEYNPQLLPSRASFAQDHWGYFNGAVENTTLLAPVDFIPTNTSYSENSLKTINFYPPLHSSANRNPHADYMQAEMLNKIIYPTGGHSVFTFEPNTVSTIEDKLIDTSVQLELANSQSSNPFLLFKSTPFTITQPQTVYFNLDGSVSGLEDILSITVGGKIKNAQGVVKSNLVWNRGDESSPSEYVYLIEPGTYSLEISSSIYQSEFTSLDDHINVSASVNYKKSLGMQQVNEMVGGIRINKIVDHDGIDESKNIEREFLYENPFLISSIDQNDYLTSVESIERETFGPSSICHCIKMIRNSTSKYLNFNGGGTIGYGKVTTNLLKTNGTNGKTVSFFSNAADLDVDQTKQFPFPPVSSRELRRGLLLQKTEYTSDNQPVQRERTKYEFEDKGYIKTLKSGMAQTDATYPNGNGNILATRYYYSYIDQINRKISTSVNYMNQGQDSLVNVSTYFYDNPLNPLPIRTETVDSKGSLLKTISRTPLEKNDMNLATPLSTDASAALDDLLNRNIIQPIIQTEQYRDGVLLNRATTFYKKWHNKITLPESIVVQHKSEAPEIRLLFTGYDSTGNLLEQYKKNDVRRAYIYDYSANYPVAETINAVQSSIAYNGFESDGKGNWSFSGIPVQDLTTPSGKKNYSLTNGSISKVNLQSSVIYHLSFWFKTVLPTINGGVLYNVRTSPGSNGWSYYEGDIKNVSSISLTGTGTIDELRLLPVNSQMTTYTYDPLVGVTSKTDTNNQVFFYEYDLLRRLSLIRDKYNKILKYYEYNYQIK